MYNYVYIYIYTYIPCNHYLQDNLAARWQRWQRSGAVITRFGNSSSADATVR